MRIDNDLILIRHAENEINDNKPNNELLLSNQGIIQANAVSKKIYGQYDVVISSTSLRAILTAKIINNGIDPIQDERLLERGFGSINHDGKETDEEARNRFRLFLYEALVKYSDKRLLLVTHGGLIRLAQDVIEERLADREPIDNCTMIKYTNGKKLILRGNWYNK